MADVRAQARALADVARFRPRLTATLVALSLLASLLEGLGLGFIIPIVELTRSGGTESSGQLIALFVDAYGTLGIPFTLEYVVVGVTAVMFVRYAASFGVKWGRAKLRYDYQRRLKAESFDAALDARIAYFDDEGSDDILNAIVTQANNAGWAISNFVGVLETTSVAAVYLVVALALAPRLTVFAITVLGGLTLLVRYVFEPAYTVGDRVAVANEDIQTAVQNGTQGIRDVKLFGMAEELRADLSAALDDAFREEVRLKRNEAAIGKFYLFASAATVFVLVYAALEFTTLSLGALGVFLFAMFRLSPKVSELNDTFYRMRGNLPHLVRMQSFVEDLRTATDHAGGDASPPEVVESVAFEDVHFGYESETAVLCGVSFSVERGEFVAFVGQSGAGKSTVVSLLARLYEPDTGRVLANGRPIEEFDIREWRSRVAVVRQSPHVFNDTLRYNLTVGNRDATMDEVERVCEIAQVTEFLNELPNDYDTTLGDNGVRLSGGQRQRVALARALLKDADILVLDEATSNLDTGIEADVQRAIEGMERDYALVTIAHRLSTVRNADRIYAVEDGRIAEVGSHGELVENDGPYAELYSSQS